MKKYRIVEYSPIEFVVQERRFFFWFNNSDGDSSIRKSYCSKLSAIQAIEELIAYEDSILKIIENEKLRIKNAKYHYIKENND